MFDNTIKILKANDLLEFVKQYGMGENRATLSRYQAAGILTLPHQFLADDVLYNDIPDIRVKYYHPVSVIEFIVNTLLFKGCWLKRDSVTHIARPLQSDVFAGRIMFFSDSSLLKKYENIFIECRIGSFKSFNFALDSNPLFQEPLISNSHKALAIDREFREKMRIDFRHDNGNDPLLEELQNMLAAEKKVDLPCFSSVSIENCGKLTLDVLTNALTYAVFHNFHDTRVYLDFQKVMYSRTFEQVVDDYLPLILQGAELKKFRVNFFTGVKE